MERRTISDLEKYCKMCPKHEYCKLYNEDRIKIETCTIRGGIETGYNSAINGGEQQANKDLPCWHRAFEICTETPYGKSTHDDIWHLDAERGSLIYIPAGSTTARCLLLKELLEKLPKEKGL